MRFNWHTSINIYAVLYGKGNIQNDGLSTVAHVNATKAYGGYVI